MPAPSSTSRRRTGRPQPGRRGAGASPGARRRPAAVPQPSALDRALDAALLVPEPEPRSFAQLGLPDALVSVLARRGISAPFAIQARTMPDALAGRDVLGRAQTGSGKTLAFGLPMLARLAPTATSRAGRPRGLVLVPTRELARQVAEELAPLGHALGVRVTTVYGGAPMGRQIASLRRGTDVVVATPGRLIDLLEQGEVSLAGVETSVLDEADHMADLGFLPAVTRLLDETPTGGQRLLFSATLDRGVDRLVERYLVDPAVHAAAPAASPVESMTHLVFTLRHEDKVAVTAEIARRPARTLLFVRTKHGADRLAKQLERAGVDAVAIHGNLNQGQRQRALDGFAAGRQRVLVATDVAARGIHVDAVDLVVHVDPPNDSKDYLHRSGRTARAGATGTVLTLVEPAQVRDVERLLAAASVTATTTAVSPGTPAVTALAESGEPVVVVPLPVAGARSPGSSRRPGAPSGGSRSRRSRYPRSGSDHRQAAHHRAPQGSRQGR